MDRVTPGVLQLDVVVIGLERLCQPRHENFGKGKALILAQGAKTFDIAEEYGTTVRDLMRANGLPNENFIHPGQRLRVYASAIPAFNSIATNNSNGRKWIEIDLSTQTLTAWQGDVPVMYSTISSGKRSTPTVTGRFQVGTKYTSQRMYGPGYDIPGVPWVMYFFADYAIHGAYWHNAFGTPTSHGCVNMRPAEAEALCGVQVTGRESARIAAQKLVNMGVQIAIVTLGATGLVYATSRESGHVPALEVEIVDLTGAGDALTAAVVFGLLNDFPVDEAVRLGASAAALTLHSRETVCTDLSLDRLYGQLVI